jgi:hypothetical protein
VIRGGRADLAPDAPKDTVNVNSGFIIAYDIVYAVNAIKKHPTGPLRPTSSSVVQGGARRPENPGIDGHRGNLESVS